jgi:hypothetical protein
MKNVIVKIFLILLSLSAHSQDNKNILNFKNAFKINLISIYNTFFDARTQIRIGIEYERKISKRAFVSNYLDFGLYDKYVFRKYYDFFNQNQGLHYEQQDVVVKGIHFIPSFNYYIFKSKRKMPNALFLGGNIDFSIYRKKLEFYNSKTSETYSQKYNQSKVALGISLGGKIYIFSRLYLEPKTSIFASVFETKFGENMNSIRPLISQWNDPEYKFWWTSNLSICYAF